jgi:hypothetical protein
MMKALGAARHPEKAGYREWLGLKPGEKWDAGNCNLKEVNRRFALLESEP